MFTPTFPTRIPNELRQELGDFAGVFWCGEQRLRASFGKAAYTAVVQGGQIRCGEQALSPSAFANLRGGGNRNAWRAVGLRFPDSEQWLLADTCRELQKNRDDAAVLTRAARRPPPAHRMLRTLC